MELILKNKNRIRTNFLIFFGILFFIIGLLIITLSTSFYKSLEREREVYTSKYSTILDNRFTNILGNYNDLLVYIGDKIIKIYDETPESISHLFVHNTELNSDFNNFFAWASFAFVKNKKIIISSEEGVLKNPLEVSNHYPIEKSLREPWLIHFGKKQTINGYDFLPISFSLTDSSGKYIGTIISSILLEQIQRELKTIKKDFNEFVILTKNNQILISSLNIDNELDLETPSTKMPIIIENNIILHSLNKTKLYPFEIISGYNQSEFNKYFFDQGKSYIKGMLLLILLLLISFLIFKRKVITPLINELSSNLEKETALREEKERILSQILSNIPSFIYRHKIVNNQITVDHISDGVKDLTGYSSEEYLDKNVNYEDIIHPDDIDRVKSEINSAIKSKTKFDITYRIKSSNNEVKWVINKGKVIEDEIFEGILTDITEIKLTEKKMQQTLEKLAKSNEELERFAYVCSHDLKEPLRTVFSYINFLKEENYPLLDEKSQDYIRIIENDTLKMRDIIENVLSYSRIDHDKKDDYTKVNLDEVINEAISSLNNAIQEKDLTINISNKENHYVSGDYNDYLRLFQNIISNAVKFNDKDHPKIEIKKEKLKSKLIIKIQDNGIGIESQYLDSVFDIFTRLNQQDKFQGTGIGLSIVKKIIDKYNGKILIESEFGIGTCIILEFDLEKESTS